MAEYQSLYVKVTIMEEKLQAFLYKSLVPNSIDGNWSACCDSRDMYARQPLKILPHYPNEINLAFFEQSLEGRGFCMVDH